MRERTERLHHAGLKFAALLATSLFTIPASVVLFAAWYVVGPFDTIAWPALWRGSAPSVAAVLFVSHAYETVFLIHGRRDDRMRIALAERARWHAELDTLEVSSRAPSQRRPISLSVLIAEEPRLARNFNLHVANLCRNLRGHNEHDLVPLSEELVLVAEHGELAHICHPDAPQVVYRGFEDTRNLHVPPASLQLLLEKALKHNSCTTDRPPVVELSLQPNFCGQQCDFDAQLPAPSHRHPPQQSPQPFMLAGQRNSEVSRSGTCSASRHRSSVTLIPASCNLLIYNVHSPFTGICHPLSYKGRLDHRNPVPAGR